VNAGDFYEKAKADNPGGLPNAYDDGGRLAAGFKGATGDCVTRAICIALGLDYRSTYDRLSQSNLTFWKLKAAKAKQPNRQTMYERRAKATARNGISPKVYEPLLVEAGWVKVSLPKGSRLDALPTEGVLIVSLRGHLAVVDHGTIRDTYDSSYGYNRLAFHYWRRAAA
jgi:hypothetical protein